MQQYAVYILFYCNITLHFGCRPRPSSGVHKTVVTATGTSHVRAATSLQRGQRPRWIEVAVKYRLHIVASRWKFINIVCMRVFACRIFYLLSLTVQKSASACITCGCARAQACVCVHLRRE